MVQYLTPTGIEERARHRIVLCLLADAFTALIPETELFMLSSCFRFVVCVKIFCARVTFSCACRELQGTVAFLFTALIHETELFTLSSRCRAVVCVKVFCARVTFSCACGELQCSSGIAWSRARRGSRCRKQGCTENTFQNSGKIIQNEKKSCLFLRARHARNSRGNPVDASTWRLPLSQVQPTLEIKTARKAIFLCSPTQLISVER